MLTGNEIAFWDLVFKIITTSITIIAVIAGAVKYLQERKRETELRREELAWRKTEFVFQLSQHFDNDKNIQSALRLIEYCPSEELMTVLRTPITELNSEQVAHRYQVDRYLDFLDRLCQFVCITGTLTPMDASCFTWYIRRVGQYKILTDYAVENGYNDLLMLYDRFKKYFQTKELSKV